MRFVGRGAGQGHVKGGDQFEFDHRVAAVGEHHALEFDVVLGAHPHGGLHAQFGPQRLQHHAVGVEGALVARGRIGGRMAAHRHRRLAALQTHVHEAAAGVAQGVVAPARDAGGTPLAPARAVGAQAHAVAPVGEQVRGLQRLCAGHHRAHMVLRTALQGFQRQVGQRLVHQGRQGARRTFVQQRGDRFQVRVRHAPALRHAPTQHVGQRHDGHALVVGHVGAHRRAGAALRLARGGEIERLDEPVSTACREAGEVAHVLAGQARIDQRGQRGGVGRDHLLGQRRAAQRQPGHALRRVLVGQRVIAPGVGTLGHSPGHGLSLRMRDLLHERRTASLAQHAAVGLGHEQRGHEVLEHRARPRAQHSMPPVGKQRTAKRGPVLDGHIALGDGQEAGAARLGGQQVVERRVQRLVVQPEPDVQQVALGVVQKAELRRPGQLFQRLRQFEQAARGARPPALGGGAAVQADRAQRGEVVTHQRVQAVVVARNLVAHARTHGSRVGMRMGNALKFQRGGVQQACKRSTGLDIERVGQRRLQHLAERALVPGLLQGGFKPGLVVVLRGCQPLLAALHGLRRGLRGVGVSRQQAAGLGHREQVHAEVAAVHGGHVTRQQRLQGLGGVPVEEVTPVALHLLQAGQRGLHALQQVLRADPSEFARARRAQQVQADVGGRGAVGHHVERQYLQVVGRQKVVARIDTALEQAPGIARQVVEQCAVGSVERVRPAAGPGLVGQPGDHWRERPQHQQGHRERRGLWTAPPQQCEQWQGHRRLQRMSPERGPQARAQGRARRVGGGPGQQLTPGDRHAPVGAQHGVGRAQRLLQQLHDVPHPAEQRAQPVRCNRTGKALANKADAVRHQTGECTQHRCCGLRGHRQPQSCGQAQSHTPHREQQQQQRRRRHQRTAQVVQQLQAVDGRDIPAACLQQEGKQLPVAAGPAVQARGGHVGVLRVRFDEGDVAHHRATRQRAFKQVVAEHPVLGQTPPEHRVHGGHVQQALAGEAALTEHVLVDVGAHGAVGVESALAGGDPLPWRGDRGFGQRRHHAGLQDAVALHHAPAAGVQTGLVVGVLGHAHQRAQAARWQLRVAVQREQVARAFRHASELAQRHERPRLFGHQRCRQLFKLAALAFPADPAALGGAQRAVPMQQQEAWRFSFAHGVVFVQCRELGHRLGKDGLVTRQVRAVGVGKVAEQRKLRVGFGVGQKVEVQAVHQGRHRGRAAQQRRDHHHHASMLRYALGQQVARQVRGPRRFGDQPVDHRHHRLRRGEHHEHQHQCRDGMVRPAIDRGAGHCIHRCHQPQRAGQHDGEVGRHARGAHHQPPPPRAAAAQAQTLLQRRPATTRQPMPRERAVTAVVHQPEQRLGHFGFTALALHGHALDAVQRGAARGVVLGREHRRSEHDLHHAAGARHDARPVGRADEPQRRDGVAHTQVVGRLIGVVLRLQCREIGHVLKQPGAHLIEEHVAGGWAVTREVLRQMKQEHAAHAAPLGHDVERADGLQIQVVDAVRDQTGEFTRGLVAGNAVGQAAQVFHLHHPQRGGQCPELAVAELLHLLVGVEKVGEQRFIERTVGVRHERPGDAVDAGQALQRCVLQHRQRAVVARGQTFVDLAQLVVDQVKVVEQPFGAGADVLPAVGVAGDVLVRRAKALDVALQARVETGTAKHRTRGVVRLGQAAAVLLETRQAEDFRPDGLQRRTERGIQHAPHGRRYPVVLTGLFAHRHLRSQPRGACDQCDEEQGGDQPGHHEATDQARSVAQDLHGAARAGANRQVVGQCRTLHR